MNHLTITFHLSFLTMLLVAMGNAIGNHSGMIIAFLIAGGMSSLFYWYSDTGIRTKSPAIYGRDVRGCEP